MKKFIAVIIATVMTVSTIAVSAAGETHNYAMRDGYEYFGLWWDSTEPTESGEYWVVDRKNGTFEYSAFGKKSLCLEGEEYKDSVKEGDAIYSKDKKTLLLFNPGAETKTFTIPKTVSKIGPYAFANNKYLQKVIIGDSVKEIGEGAFEVCHDLKSVSIGNGVTEIEKYTFSNCHKLLSVSLGSNVEVIRKHAFTYSTEKLEDGIVIPDSVKTIETGAFFCIDGEDDSIYTYNTIKKVKIGKGLKQGLEELCFGKPKTVEISKSNKNYKVTKGLVMSKNGKTILRYVGKSTTVKIDGKARTIGKAAFSQTKVKRIKGAKNVKTIDREAFYECPLKEIDGLKKLKTIGEYAFGNTRLKKIYLSNSVKTIKKAAFSVSTLKSVRLPKGLKRIEAETFSYTDLKTIKLPKKLKEIGKGAFSHTKLKQIEIPKSTKLDEYALEDINAKVVLNKNVQCNYIFATNEKYNRAKMLKTWLPKIKYNMSFKKIVPANVSEWTWSPVEGATGYQVELMEDNVRKKITTKSVGIPLESLKSYNSTRMKYRVRAYKKNKKGKKVYTKWSAWGAYEERFIEAAYFKEWMAGEDDPGA